MLGYCICLSSAWGSDWGVPWHSVVWPTPQNSLSTTLETLLDIRKNDNLRSRSMKGCSLKSYVRTELYEGSRWLSFLWFSPEVFFFLSSFLQLLCHVFCTWIYSSFLSFFECNPPLIPFWFVHFTTFDLPFSFCPPTSFTEHSWYIYFFPNLHFSLQDKVLSSLVF